MTRFGRKVVKSSDSKVGKLVEHETGRKKWSPGWREKERTKVPVMETERQKPSKLVRGSRGETKELLILPASWGGNSSQLTVPFSEIRAEGKMEERRENGGRSGKKALAPFPPRCVESTAGRSACVGE